MEWTLPVNDILTDEITKLDYTLIPPGYQGDVRSVRAVQESLSKMINQLGEQSATAQGLNRPITTTAKLQNSPSYILYLLKDCDAKGGGGEVIGLLKVGRKHLFLFDERGKVTEVEPLCVLDFYVAHDRQRRGYGRMLFERMLRDAGARPHQLAIDGPSPKMERFLAKNYGIERLLRQSNNFAVAPGFFESAKDVSVWETPAEPSAAVGRFTARQPPSNIANVIHGGNDGYRDSSNGDGRTSRGSRATTPAAPPDAAPASAPAAVPAAAPASAPTAVPTSAPEPEPQPPARPSSLRVEPVTSSEPPPRPPSASAGLVRRDPQLTEHGYFDVKYFHNKLW